jgi:hypothetical protein
VDSHITERFGNAGVPKERISTTRDTFHFISHDRSPAQIVESFRRFYGPTMNAYEAAEKNGEVEDLHGQLVALAKAHNKSSNGGTQIPATFLKVTINL